MTNQNEEQRLADYLPYEYRKKAETGEETDTLRFLKAFERILLGLTDDNKVQDPDGNNVNTSNLNAIDGLEDIIARQADIFNPTKTPAGFLPWLSQWVALVLRADISESKQRAFIAKIASLYPMRGTKANMVTLLAMFIDRNEQDVTIEDKFNTVPTPHFFKVLLNLSSVKDSNNKEDYDRAEQQAHSIIRLAKPAHTCYQLIPQFDTFRIGPYNSCPNDTTKTKKDCPIILGKNTRLGMADWKK